MPSAFVPGALEPRQARLHSSLSMHPGHPCLSSRSRPVDFEAGLRDPSSKNPCANSSRSERALLGVGSDIAAGSLRGRGPSHPEPSWFAQPGLAGGSSHCNLNGRQINCKDAGLAESHSVVRIGQASRSWDRCSHARADGLSSSSCGKVVFSCCFSLAPYNTCFAVTWSWCGSSEAFWLQPCTDLRSGSPAMCHQPVADKTTTLLRSNVSPSSRSCNRRPWKLMPTRP